MNTYDIFRKLTRGLKFNQSRFKDDLQRLGVSKKGEGVKEVSNLRSNEEEEQEQDDDLLSEVVAGNENHSEEEEEADSPIGNKEDEGGGLKIATDIHFDKISTSKKKKRKRKKRDEDNKQSEKQRLLQMKQEQVNRIRNKNGIHVWGTDVPEPTVTFDKLVEEYKVSEVIISNLRSQGFTEPMPIQMQAWPLMLQGREVLGSAPTGSGKTAAFLVPILHQLKGPCKKGFRAVLLAPTRELARQTHRECIRLSEGLGFRVHIISNVSRAKLKFGPNSSKKFDILVTTPNRLVYLLQDGDTPVIDLSNVEWLVIDESDRLFEGGSGGFRDQLAVIYQACTNPNVRRALFSATFAYEVQHWCKLNLNNVTMVSIGIRNTASEDVQQELLFCGTENGKLIALRDLLRKGYKPPVLVFVQTKERAKELFRELIYDNIMVDAIHADRTQLQRDNVVRAFRERKIWVLICTELMARGIDFKGVNMVINYDFPQSVISYIHRVGRTGRAHHKGRAVTFWTTDDKPSLQSIAQVIHNSHQEVPEWMLNLKKLTKKQKQQKLRSAPERGHVSQYDIYRECDYRNQKIMENRKRKREKRAARIANGEEEPSPVEEISGEGFLADTSDSNPKPVKRKKVNKDKSKLKKNKKTIGKVNGVCVPKKKKKV